MFTLTIYNSLTLLALASSESWYKYNSVFPRGVSPVESDGSFSKCESIQNGKNINTHIHTHSIDPWDRLDGYNIQNVRKTERWSIFQCIEFVYTDTFKRYNKLLSLVSYTVQHIRFAIFLLFFIGLFCFFCSCACSLLIFALRAMHLHS